MRLEVAHALVSARCWGRCEGCGTFGPVEVHHRLARGAGGVYGEARDIANSPRNLLALCRPCHNRTEHADTWRTCEELGWRFRHGIIDPREQPALIVTVQGSGWWYLTENGGYRFADLADNFRLPVIDG